ncbi:MAG: DUF2817 domain-containing protein [Candidatus Aminicenantes bacterium]|nr:MAG: DUF2817 domain-containing protein [Candidatus Aminicenantes bacterium]
MRLKKVYKTLVFIGLGLLFLSSIALAETVKTPAEKTNYTQYSQNEKITHFLGQVDHLSNEMTVQIIGQTKETRNYGEKDLYLCIITEEGADCPHKLNRNKPTFLLVATQHGNEQSAKEAALWLIRDLALGDLKPLLKKTNFLIIPQANPYGNWFDQRRNEQDLDLNRDHVKLEAPEVKAIHRVFREWMPEVTMDVHEKGDDFYQVSIGCVSNANISYSLQKFSRNTILTEVEENLKKRRITFHEYLITQRMGVDSSAGVRYRPEDMGKPETMKRYSTTDLNDGRNSLGIYETLSFIQEGASRHDIETLKERTIWQYYGIRFFTESIARHGEKINSMVRGFRENLLEKAKVYSEEDLVHLRMQYARDEDEPELKLKKQERTETPIRGILKVDKKAGDPLTQEDIAPYPYPRAYKIVDEVVTNWFPKVEPIVSTPRPLGYIIPAEHLDVIDTMLFHEIKIETFTKDMSLEVEAYGTVEVVPAKYDYLPPEKIDVEKKTLQTIVKKGDFYISCAQAGANLIPCLLEPESQYGFIRYWKFKLVPEAGNFFPFYRFVKPEELPLIPYKNWVR